MNYATNVFLTLQHETQKAFKIIRLVKPKIGSNGLLSIFQPYLVKYQVRSLQNVVLKMATQNRSSLVSEFEEYEH